VEGFSGRRYHHDDVGGRTRAGVVDGGSTRDRLVTRVIGVDACRKGWVGVASDLRGYFGATIDQLIATADGDGQLKVVAIDIPIGLPLTGTRRADILARGLVGKRKSSVFPTPIRPALLATSYAEGSALNVRATGKGITRQAYGLGKRILEVDAWVRTVDRRVIEVHPEVCFAMLAGHPLEHSKWSWAGAEERRRLLASAGIVVPAEIGMAGELAGVDDVLDAAVASWTARRYAEGRASCHPETPERFDDGPVAAIWV
jgi:predicted RNase H-like nuclease